MNREYSKQGQYNQVVRQIKNLLQYDMLLFYGQYTDLSYLPSDWYDKTPKHPRFLSNQYYHKHW